MASRPRKPRTRLDPAERRKLILDHAAEVVGRDGVAAISMESIGQAAGVSKSLVYNYFPNLNELLSELLERELRMLRREQSKAAQGADTFEGLVRGITHAYIKYIDERGLIIDRLQAEPSVSAVHDPTEYGRDAAVDYLADIIGKHFGLPPDIAQAAIDISFGLPASAGMYLLRDKSRHSMTWQQVEDITVTMIVGAIMALKDDYVLNRQSLRAD
ncbi:TetR/AcrR family transcriptional regulator [Erythrobacter ani]|uniref:TetR/AcrR family transcriptional regulator n=1 Tax=Erythrobacter ani TaxID=2827235 RepID=A0ABS6SKW8_9SPHN|nr:TetR/AcrR family transcriptional regulator [Erythrobacter ani]MBV7265172.1 TetR/AcrR family transcriptional regulator [Erythrobacter ani]